MTPEQKQMFNAAVERLNEYGPGKEFRSDLPDALRNVASTYGETGGLTPLQGLVIGAAARRLDQIAGEIYPERGDTGTIQLAADLRVFRHREGG